MTFYERCVAQTPYERELEKQLAEEQELRAVAHKEHADLLRNFANLFVMAFAKIEEEEEKRTVILSWERKL